MEWNLAVTQSYTLILELQNLKSGRVKRQMQGLTIRGHPGAGPQSGTSAHLCTWRCSTLKSALVSWEWVHHSLFHFKMVVTFFVTSYRNILFLILQTLACLSLNFLNWSIVDLQCCVNFFFYTAKWISYIHTYIYFFKKLFSHIGHYRVLSRVPCAVQ